MRLDRRAGSVGVAIADGLVGDAVVRRGQMIVRPPSTISMWPATMSEASEAR